MQQVQNPSAWAVDVSGVSIGSPISTSSYIELIWVIKIVTTGNLTHTNEIVERPRIPPHLSPGQYPGYDDALPTTANAAPWDVSRRFLTQRDLLDPARCATISMAAGIKGLDIPSFIPYLRSYNFNTIAAATYNTPIGPRSSVVLVDINMSDLELANFINSLTSHREILPSRVSP